MINDVPAEITGASPMVAWLNKLRRAVIARTPQSTPSSELIRTPQGFTYKPIKRQSTPEPADAAGIFRGKGWIDTDDGKVFPSVADPDTTFNTFDFIHYTSSDPENLNQKRATWLFGWGGGDDSAGDFGPIHQMGSGAGIWIPITSGKWFLMAYTQIDSDAEERPDPDAAQRLKDCYPLQNA